MTDIIYCFNCNKKIKLIPFKCKCDNNYCLKCKDPLDHNCQFDFKKLNKEILEKKNPIIKPKKI